ncbi:type II toxin-antitoxin system HicB family antitoxin [Endozoicomonas ascidiicola]|uniref:type II toxin-antitoxin system HicB family antitoxin n=1 Tax=Endozoicomonas ascidiicola TaxID=1698521 RepID=UPI000836D2AF|nr:type II toxin-antitoxin system HicB family antitoxin [Endozoicomonas ascidiicola]
MLFRIGIETPEDSETAYSIIIPALCNDDYTTVSAADTFEEIVPMAREAAFSMMEEMALNDDLDLVTIAKANQTDFSKDPEYSDFNEWAFIDIDVDGVVGAQKRINISMSDLLISHIDQVVRHGSQYKDRSDFLSKAALNQLSH